MDSTTSEFDITYLQNGSTVQDFIEEKINESVTEKDAFYVCDLGDLLKKHLRWVKALPRVTPFYAVKCNDIQPVVKTLMELGIGFDCASKNEIQQILSLGADPSQIIFANPCKQISHISYASAHGVQMMTFDSEEELIKVAQHHSTAKLLLRIFTDCSKAKHPLSKKFGASLHTCRGLLEQAKELGLDVIGVSFHVGSGCIDPEAFSLAITDAHLVFQTADELGFRMNVLDIGGGFPGSDFDKPLFEEITAVINPALDKYFPADSGVRLIAEPGTFYVESCCTLIVNVIAKKVIQEKNKETSDRNLVYYVNDGLHTSFTFSTPDELLARPHRKIKKDEVFFPCCIWGQTCNSRDIISECCYLPELQVGDWLLFENRGAYSISLFSTFNGFPKPYIYFIMPHSAQ